MQAKGFSIGEMVKFGWRVMKENIPFFIGVILTMLVINNLPYFIGMAAKIPSESAWNILLAVASVILGIWINIGIFNIALAFARHEKPKFSELFSRYDLIWNYFAASFLYILLLIAGLLLLVFPMFIWGSKYGLFPYFIVEKGAGPLESLKMSAEATMGAKWDVFGLWLLVGVINLLGLLCLGVGLFATLPTTWVAFAYAYRTLVSQTEH